MRRLASHQRVEGGRPLQNVKPLVRKIAIAATERAELVARRHNWSVAAATSPQTGFADFNVLLHELRSAELSRMPKPGGTLLSAGCSGTLYFDWLARCYGPIERHIGLELFLPQPEVLPPEVEWIKRSVADMEGVADRAVGLVFSGQNIEHLFGDDAVDFLLESARVLHLGGWLVIDSPHREITRALGWSQPEHTIEFTPAEAAELATLAGFDVTDVRGIWLCREPTTGETLPMWPTGTDVLPATEILRRAVLGVTNPENSFIWWLEAKRADREPDVVGLRRRHAEIYAVAWPERQQRLHHAVGSTALIGERQIVQVNAGTVGYALFGPFMPLVPGRNDVVFRVRRNGHSDGSRVAVLDVCDGAGEVLASKYVPAGDLPSGEWTELRLPFVISELRWGGQFRVFSTGVDALEVEMRVELLEHEGSPAPSKAAS